MVGWVVRKGRKKHDLFSKLLWCFPLFCSSFSLDAHHNCQWRRNCCRDTKELLKLHLWQLLQQGAVCGTKECYLKPLTENVQKKNQLLLRLCCRFKAVWYVTLKILYCQQQISATDKYFLPLKWQNYIYCQKYKGPLGYAVH